MPVSSASSATSPAEWALEPDLAGAVEQAAQEGSSFGEWQPEDPRRDPTDIRFPNESIPLQPSDQRFVVAADRASADFGSDTEEGANGAVEHRGGVTVGNDGEIASTFEVDVTTTDDVSE